MTKNNRNYKIKLKLEKTKNTDDSDYSIFMGESANQELNFSTATNSMKCNL